METLEKPIASKTELNHRFTSLYEECFPAVAGFVSRRKGSFQDAKDIFQDALIIYHEKSLKDDFKVEISPEAYVLGIARHLWARKVGDDRRKVSVDNQESLFAIPANYFPDVNENLLLRFLEKAGEKCMSLLKLFYFGDASMKELSERFGFQSEHSAAVQKYKCIEKVRETVRQKSISYEDFLE